MTIVSYLRALAKNLVVKWKEPSWQDEFGEMKLTSKELGIPLILIRKSFENGNLIKPVKSFLKNIENTDYNEVKTIDDVKQFAKVYGRNADVIIDGFEKGTSIPAPIVLIRKDKRPYLIAGNTRLMVSKALEIIPEIYAIYI